MRLLIVEDDAPLASGLSRILEAEGHAVDVTARGEAAVLAAAEAEPWVHQALARDIDLGFELDPAPVEATPCSCAKRSPTSCTPAMAWLASGEAAHGRGLRVAITFPHG